MKKVIIVLGVLTVAVMAAFFMVAHGLSYRVAGYRDYNQRLDGQHFREIQGRFDYAYDATSSDLRRFTLKNTAAELSFDMHPNALQNPNAILERKNGHCKMYSFVMASSYNQLAKTKKIDGHCRVAYGYVYLYGVNLHQFSNTAFFRDHDFCVIRDKSGVHAADALMYDYFMVDKIRLRK